MAETRNPAKLRKCTCTLCNWHKRIEQSKKYGNRKQLIQLIEDLSNWALEVSGDANYYAAIVDGSWPSAVEQLTKALRKAKQFRKQQEIAEVSRG